MKKFKDRRISNEFDERQELKVNENLLRFYNKEVRIDCELPVEASDFKIIDNGLVISDKAYKRLHPDNINNSYFWKRASELSLSTTFIGTNLDTRDVTILNESSLNGHHRFTKNYIDDKITEDSTILEIGPGLGCIKEYIEKNYNINNYYAIDINKKFEYERLYKCDGKSIPLDMKFDIIYSHNVFQHLSKKQRLGYFRDIKRVLKDDGEFTFSLFVRTENNKHLFTFKRTNGTYLSNFYNQFIEIPSVDEILYEVRSNSLKISLEKEVDNVCFFKVTK